MAGTRIPLLRIESVDDSESHISFPERSRARENIYINTNESRSRNNSRTTLGVNSRNSYISVDSSPMPSPRIIDQEDMDDFMDIQDGIMNALGDGWLPKREESDDGGIPLQDMGRASDGASSMRHRRLSGKTEISVEVEEDEVPETLSSAVRMKLFGHSLGIIPPYNFWRRKIAAVLAWKRYDLCSKILLTVLTFVYTYRTFDPVTHGKLYNFGDNGADWVIVLLHIAFTVEISAKIVAFGFWDDSQMFRACNKQYKTVWVLTGLQKVYDRAKDKYWPQKPTDKETSTKRELRSSVTMANLEDSFDTAPRAFARSSWNRVDLVSTACYWVSLFLTIKNFDYQYGIRIFKALGALRILRLLDTDTGISDILKSFKIGIRQLLNVGFVLLYFWVLFGILGVQSFKGSFRRQCVWTNPTDSNDTFINSGQYCGGYLDAVTGLRKPFEFEDGTAGPMSKGFLCPMNSKCISQSEMGIGSISFDNILNSMELVFVVMTANTFTDLMYDTMDSDNMATSIFFIFTIFTLCTWLINLVIAVLVSSFEIAREQQKVKNKAYWFTKWFQWKTPENIPFLAIYERFEWMWVLTILIDLIAKCTITDRSSQKHYSVLYTIECIVTLFLLVESLLRIAIFAGKMRLFLTNFRFILDLFLAVITSIIIIPVVKDKLGAGYNWLAFFQIIRFYRIVLSISITKNMWKKVLGNGLMIWNLSSFYFLLLFLASIIFSLYCEGFIPYDDVDENPFGMYTLANSFISLYTITSTENWTDTMYAVQQNAPNEVSAFFAGVLFIAWFILSNFMVLNIFIAVIAENLEVEEEDKRTLQVYHYLQHEYPKRLRHLTENDVISRFKTWLTGKREDESRDFKQFLFRGTAILSIIKESDKLSTLLNPPVMMQKDVVIRNLHRALRKVTPAKILENNPFLKVPRVRMMDDTIDGVRKVSLELDEYEEEKLAYLKKHQTYNYSFFILPPNHAFRKFCQKLTPSSHGRRFGGVEPSRWYGDFFVIFMFICTVLMVIEGCYVTPIYRRDHLKGLWNWDLYAESAFVVVFSLEFMVKVIADGFIYSPNAYLMNQWNRIDLVVLASLWINYIAVLNSDGNLSRIVRGLKALRALRFLTISNTARNTFKVLLFDGFTKIFGAGIISMSLLFPFTVWGLQLFAGSLGVCNDGNLDKSGCYNEFENTVGNWNIVMPRAYTQPYLEFNSFQHALSSLFQIISLEGWVDLLGNLMNSTGVGQPASAFATPYNGVYLVMFNFASMVFILNLFISFIISNHAKNTGSAYLTVPEKAWLEIKKLLGHTKPISKPHIDALSPLRKFCYNLAIERNNLWYAVALQIVLYVHILALLLESYKSGHLYRDIIYMISSTVFLAHYTMALIGEGYQRFVSKKWNLFAFIVSFGSFILNIIQLKIYRYVVGFTNLRDFFLLAMFAFVIPQNDVLSDLINTASASLPAIISLIYTWAILFLVYAVALNQVFGLTRLGPNTTDNINCRTVTKSLLLLFRMSFGEGWNYIMDDMAVEAPYCTTTSKGTDCGSKPYAYLLFMSWNILSMYIFVNMFISLIVENFSYVYRGDTDLGRDDIRKFQKAWQIYDSDGIGYIQSEDLPKVMHRVNGKLSFKIWEGRLTIKELLKNHFNGEGYDVSVNLRSLNKELNSIDFQKLCRRRHDYNRFIQESKSETPGLVKYKTVITLIPLYTMFNLQNCLGIDEYVKKVYMHGKIDKILLSQRTVDVLKMVITRWKFLRRRQQRIL